MARVAAVLVLLAAVSASAAAQDATRKTVRDVTPPGVLRVFRDDVGARPHGRVTSIAIEHPAVKPNGIIEGDGFVLRLDGIDFPATNRLCADAAGERWPCGRRAYISLYNKIHNDRIDCEPKGTSAAAGAPRPASCFVGDLNLAEWLLRDGLVTRTADSTDRGLVDAETTAKQARLGLWRDTGRQIESAR